MAAADTTMLIRRVGVGGRMTARFRRVRWADRITLGLVLLVTLVAIFGPLLAPHDPLLPAGQAYQPPSAEHLFGTDNVGRDMFSRVLSGIQTTWFSAFIVIGSGIIVGGAIGLIAGAKGGWIDSVLMRITDICLALPGTIVAVAVVAALGRSLAHTLFAVALLWWPYYARLVRADVRTLVARPHMEAARLAGTGRVRRLLRHLLPGALPVVIVAASLDVANLIIVLAGLSFIGLGAPPPAPELGQMTAVGLQDLLSSWWIPVIPALCVFALSLLGNLAGDSVRDTLER